MAFSQSKNGTTDSYDEALADLEGLRKFTGPPADFWPAYINKCIRLIEAELGLLFIKNDQGKGWRTFSIQPSNGLEIIRSYGIGTKLEEIADLAEDQGVIGEFFSGAGKGGGMLSGSRLNLDDQGQIGVAVFFTRSSSSLDMNTILTRLNLVSNVPSAYQMSRVVEAARSDVIRYAETLDLMVLLNEETRFMAAAMTICNELASRYKCERVSLGWLEGNYVRVKAISHMEKFEKKMDAVQQMEAVMEEAVDQDEEILLPRPTGSSSITRDVENFAREQGAGFVATIPLRLDDKLVGALTCERSVEAFSENEVQNLRLVADQVVRRLSDLKKHDRWLGARMGSSVRDSAAKLLGVEHTFAKLLGIAVFVALAVLIFGKMDYRVEAPFVLGTDDLAYLPAPFDGYIDKVEVEVGDKVNEGDTLITLDTSELLLEESTAVANENRYARESDKARAENDLANMRIAQALAEQASARLKLVRYHLGQAKIISPFTGVVVEGDLDELLGAPVRKGDVLFKVAKLNRLYVECDVDERDAHSIVIGSSGEIAFISQPKYKYPIRVERVDPVALAKGEGNVFIMRAVLVDKPEDWWRPGMSGISKIDVGRRSILWIITHRTVDFLRIFLWW